MKSGRSEIGGEMSDNETVSCADQRLFHAFDLAVVVFDGLDVGLGDELLDGFVEGGAQGGAPAGLGAGMDLRGLEAVGHEIDHGEAEDAGAVLYEGESAADEGADGADGARADEGGRDAVGAEAVGELLGVALVVLVLVVLDGAQIVGVGHDVGEVLVLAEIGEPGAHEAAFEGEGQVVAVGFDQLTHPVQVVVPDVLVDQDRARAVHDAQVEVAGM